MTKIDKKIGNLEDKILDKFTWKSTLIAPECLTETEKKLFDQPPKLILPKKLEQIPEFTKFTNKFTYYCIRRGVDMFMKMMGGQLCYDSSEQFLFWFRFMDFVSETMFILNRDRGSKFISESILGENPDDWPDDDDPKWKEVEDAEEKWYRDLKEFWDHTSLTMDKIFSNLQDNLVERASKQEELEIEETSSPNRFGMYEFFAESISIGLSYPSRTDIIMLANMSLSSKEKTLLGILDKLKAEQKE